MGLLFGMMCYQPETCIWFTWGFCLAWCAINLRPVSDIHGASVWHDVLSTRDLYLIYMGLLFGMMCYQPETCIWYTWGFCLAWCAINPRPVSDIHGASVWHDVLSTRDLYLIYMGLLFGMMCYQPETCIWYTWGFCLAWCAINPRPVSDLHGASVWHDVLSTRDLYLIYMGLLFGMMCYQPETCIWYTWGFCLAWCAINPRPVSDMHGASVWHDVLSTRDLYLIYMGLLFGMMCYQPETCIWFTWGFCLAWCAINPRPVSDLHGASVWHDVLSTWDLYLIYMGLLFGMMCYQPETCIWYTWGFCLAWCAINPRPVSDLHGASVWHDVLSTRDLYLIGMGLLFGMMCYQPETCIWFTWGFCLAWYAINPRPVSDLHGASVWHDVLSTQDLYLIYMGLLFGMMCYQPKTCIWFTWGFCLAWCAINPRPVSDLHGASVWHDVLSTQDLYLIYMGLLFGMMCYQPETCIWYTWGFCLAWCAINPRPVSDLHGASVWHDVLSTRDLYLICMGLLFGMMCYQPETCIWYAWGFCLAWCAINPRPVSDIHGASVWHDVLSTRDLYPIYMGLLFGMMCYQPETCIRFAWGFCLAWCAINPRPVSDMHGASVWHDVLSTRDLYPIYMGLLFGMMCYQPETCIRYAWGFCLAWCAINPRPVSDMHGASVWHDVLSTRDLYLIYMGLLFGMMCYQPETCIWFTWGFCLAWCAINPRPVSDLHGASVWHDVLSTRDLYLICMGLLFGMMCYQPETCIWFAWGFCLAWCAINPRPVSDLHGASVWHDVLSTRDLYLICMGLLFGMMCYQPETCIWFAWGFCLAWCAINPRPVSDIHGASVWHDVLSTRDLYLIYMGLLFGMMCYQPETCIWYTWGFCLAWCAINPRPVSDIHGASVWHDVLSTRDLYLIYMGLLFGMMCYQPETCIWYTWGFCLAWCAINPRPVSDIHGASVWHDVLSTRDLYLIYMGLLFGMMCYTRIENHHQNIGINFNIYLQVYVEFHKWLPINF